MEVEEAVAAAGDGGLGAHIDLCHFSAALSPLHLFPTLSPFTSHHTHVDAHTQSTHKQKSWAHITQKFCLQIRYFYHA